MWMCMLFLPILCFTVKGEEVFETRIRIPAVITTWKFVNATQRAWDVLYKQKGSAVDAVEAGCSVCEYEQCEFTVGYGGSPDENGETTLDAMLMDGNTMNVGAVGGLRRIKNAIGVARKVLDYTHHSFLVGEMATQFALGMGFKEENLTTYHSLDIYQKWKRNDCQPNFRVHVTPDPDKTCGPYHPYQMQTYPDRYKYRFGINNHDTIGMVVIDLNMQMASGTSTNGASHKIPGRVGDSPIPGAGSYVDGEIGGAAATGDGDIMIRYLPSFLAVEEMKKGANPQKAAMLAIDRIACKTPDFRGAVIVLRKDGEFGAACAGLDMFPYCVFSPVTGTVKTFYKSCKTYE